MRLITLFLVLGLCGFAVVHGWEVTEFVTAQMSVRNDGTTVDRLREWVDVSGVAGAAREALLSQARSGAAPIDPHRWTDRLTSLLEMRPLAAIDWLSLAGARVVAAAPEEQVLSALTMSRIGGPNEGAVMLQRAIFGLLEWETLPEDERAQTARDLSGALLEGSVADGAIGVMRGVLAAKPAEIRAEIGGMLGSEQVSSQRLAQIGL